MKNTVTCANILIPKKNVDLYKYSCVACDQFTGNGEYWKSVEETVGNAPSALKMIFPEIYLSKDSSLRTNSINSAMNRYLTNGIFDTYTDAVIYVRRTLDNGKVRQGVIIAVDLEDYSYKKDSFSPIRPTEGTVEDRLPPRVAVRKNAPLELPHVMLLIDDKSKNIIEPLEYAQKTEIYSTPLMMNGGSIKGFLLKNSVRDGLLNKINGLKTSENSLMLAVGDGNHSLATAKKYWEEIKQSLTEKEAENHPARYALCEVVNLHDSSLEFEPIHRILYKTDRNVFKDFLKKHSSPDGQEITVIFGNEKKIFRLKPTHTLTVGTVQNIIDEFLSENGGEVDYIHEPEQVEKNALQQNAVGILVPCIDKSDLFPSVEANGPLPRKTFSMGMGKDKRYYLEARKIK